jgi:hypothetical protein
MLSGRCGILGRRAVVGGKGNWETCGSLNGGIDRFGEQIRKVEAGGSFLDSDACITEPQIQGTGGGAELLTGVFFYGGAATVPKWGGLLRYYVTLIHALTQYTT